MKKILALAVVAMITGSINAQTLSFGPTVGFGHSWLRLPKDADGFNREFHPSYNLGAKLVYSFVSDWGVSADVKFSSEGGKFEGGPNGDEYKFRANYIRVPLQAIYFFEQLGDGVRPKVSLGPSFGFLVGGEQVVKEDGEPTVRTDVKDVANTFDFGVTGAVGANIRLGGNKWLNTDITYYHGINGVFDGPGSNSDNYKNSGLGLNIGLLFPINSPKKK